MILYIVLVFQRNMLLIRWPATTHGISALSSTRFLLAIKFLVDGVYIVNLRLKHNTLLGQSQRTE